jgi:glycosyltransferase involved in cell wall biosynthesis
VKIGLVTEYFPPFAPGGAEWSTLELARALVERGDAVTVITPNYGSAADEVMDGVHVVRFAYLARLRGRRTLPARWLASPLFYLWSAVAIWWIARKASVDLLHAQNKYSMPGTWIASRLLGIPCFVTVRDTLSICALGRCFMCYEHVPATCGRGQLWQQCQQEHIEVYIRPRSSLGRLKARISTEALHVDTWIRRWFLRHTDGIIAVSQGILTLYDEAGLTQQSATAVIYNLPPQPARASVPDPEETLQRYALGAGPIILYVGKFSPGKGTPDLLEAAQIVQTSWPSAQFVFVGGSAAELGGGGKNVHVLGRIPNQDVLQLQRCATLVVVPSVWPEPLSRVLLEAMAMGRAVIGTKVGGTPEAIVDGQNGRLVARSSPTALAQAIVELLDKPEQRQQMGVAGQHLIHSRFNRESSIARYIAFYQSLQRKL